MLSESQAAFEIGLWGPTKARSFLQNLLTRFQGNVTAAAGASNEPPIHSMTAAEDAATDKQAIKEWNEPEPESLHQKAVNFIFAHNGCLSGEVKRTMMLQGATPKQWMIALKRLNEDPRVRKEGVTRSTRWFKA
jgi:hypothetical protein